MRKLTTTNYGEEMGNETQLYQVEVNANFCFYIDVEACSVEEARGLAYERAYDKAEELAGDGCDEDMTYGFAQPEIGTVTNEDGEAENEKEKEDAAALFKTKEKL